MITVHLNVEPIPPDFTSDEFNFREEDLSTAPRPPLDFLHPPPRLETDEQPLPGFTYPDASAFQLVETRQYQRRYAYVAPVDLKAIDKGAERERLMSVIEPPELHPKLVDDHYVVRPVPGLVRPPAGVPLALEVVGSPGDYITIFAVHTLESLRSELEFDDVYRDCVLVMQGLCGTDYTGDYPGVPRGLVDMGMQHNNRSRHSFNIASTVVQVGDGIFAPAAQIESEDFRAVSGTVLAALSRIKAVITKKTFSLFEQKIMEFNSVDNNVLGFNIASTVVQVGDGIFAPAAQIESEDFRAVSGTVLAALSRIKAVITKKTFSLFEQKIMEFNSVDNNVLGCGGTQWSNATNVQVNITSLQQSLRKALSGQGKMHPDPGDAINHLTVFFLFVCLPHGSHGGTFVEARTGAYVDDEECWPRILVFDATRPHAGSDLLPALREADEVIAETAERAWRLRREVRFGVVTYTKSAAQERTSYMSITPTVRFGNNSFAPAHIARERNFAQQGETILGGADAAGIRLGRELLFSFWNSICLSNLTLEEDINDLAAKLKYKNDAGEWVSIGTLPFNPQDPKDQALMKRMRGLGEYRYRQHLALHIYLLRAGMKKAHVKKRTQNSENAQNVGLTGNVFSPEDVDESLMDTCINGSLLEIVAITEDGMYRVRTDNMECPIQEVHHSSTSVPTDIVKKFFRKCAPHLLPDDEDEDNNMEDPSAPTAPRFSDPTSPEQPHDGLPAPPENVLPVGNTEMVPSIEQLTSSPLPPKVVGDHEPESEDEMDNPEGNKPFITSVIDHRGLSENGDEFELCCYVRGAPDPEWIMSSRLRVDPTTMALVDSDWTKARQTETGDPAVPVDLQSQRQLRVRKGKQVDAPIGNVAAVSSTKRKRSPERRDGSESSAEQSEDAEQGAFDPTGLSSMGSDSDSDFNPARSKPPRKRPKKTDRLAKPMGLNRVGALANLLHSAQIEHECDTLEQDLQRISSKPSLLRRTKVNDLMTDCAAQNRMFSLLQVGANTAALDVLSRTSMQLETLRGATETLQKLADGESLINLLSFVTHWTMARAHLFIYRWCFTVGPQTTQNLFEIHRKRGKKGFSTNPPLGNLVDHIVQHVVRCMPPETSSKSSHGELGRRIPEPEVFPAHFYGVFGESVRKRGRIAKGSETKTAGLKLLNPVVGQARQGAVDLNDACTKCLMELLTRSFITPALQVYDTHLRSKSNISLDHAFNRGICRGAIIDCLDRRFGDGACALSGLRAFLATPWTEVLGDRSERASKRLQTDATSFLQPMEDLLLQRFNADPALSVQIQRMGQLMVRIFTQLTGSTSPSASTSSPTVPLVQGLSPLTPKRSKGKGGRKSKPKVAKAAEQPHVFGDIGTIVDAHKPPNMAPLALLLREVRNEKLGLDPEDDRVHRLLNGFHCTDPDSPVRRPRDWFNPLREELDYMRLFKQHFTDEQLRSSTGIICVLCWFATGQGQQTATFLNRLKAEGSSFFAETEDKMVNKFVQAFQLQEVVEYKEIWGRTSRENGFAAGPDATFPERVRAKFAPYFAATALSTAWSTQLEGRSKLGWAETVDMINAANLAPFKSDSLTRFQMVNSLAFLDVVEMPSTVDIGRWLCANRQKGAVRCLEFLGFKVDRDEQIIDSFACFHHLFGNLLCPEDLEIFGQSTPGSEQSLCKVIRLNKYLSGKREQWMKDSDINFDWYALLEEVKAHELPTNRTSSEGLPWSLPVPFSLFKDALQKAVDEQGIIQTGEAELHWRGDTMTAPGDFVEGSSSGRGRAVYM